MLSGDRRQLAVVEAAMAAGREPRDIYVEVLAPTLHAVGDLWQSGAVGNRAGTPPAAWPRR